MAGLLDLFDNPDAQIGLGLLAAAAPRADAAGFGQRLMEGVNSAQGMRDAITKRQLAQMQMQQAGLINQKTKLELANEQRQFDDAQKTREVLQGIYSGSGLPQSPIPSAPLGQGAGLPADVQAGLPPEMRTPVIGAMPGAQQTSTVASPVTSGSVPSKINMFERYRGIGDTLASKGLVDPAKQYYDMAEKFRPKYNTTPQQMMVGGKLVNVLVSEDGTAKTLDGFEVKPDMIEQSDNQRKWWVNKNDPTQLKPIQVQMSPAEADASKRGWSEQNLQRQRMGYEFGTTPEGENGIRTLAQGIADGSFPAPTGMALSNPRMVRALEMVKQINPNYDFTDVTAKKNAATAFTSGPLGNQMRSFATAGQHLDQLSELVDGLNNRDNNTVNKVGNVVSSWNGGVPVNNFDAAKDIVSKEVMKAIIAGGGGEGERTHLAAQLDNAKSPAQLKGVISQYRNLMGAQYGNLLEQRRAAGLSDTTLPKYTDTSVSATKPSSGQWGIQKVGP
jgi:hypothetical protein